MRFHMPAGVAAVIKVVFIIAMLSYTVNGAVTGNNWWYALAGACLFIAAAVQVKPRRRTSRKRARWP
jgi:uncharacterized membrane protein